MGLRRQLVVEVKRALTIVVCAAMGLGSALLSEPSGLAQTQNMRSMQTSDLARENDSHVAASAAEIKPLLIKDSGLMVELKRWLAKDATTHGQIVTDADLTNDAIFARLESDVQFRAVATIIVQKYGYLVPQVNPDSEAGKEQQLLIQERVKWIAQEEEQERQQAHAEEALALQKGRSCAMGVQTDCPSQQTRTSPTQNLQRQRQFQLGQPQSPEQPNAEPPNGPTPELPFPGQGTNPLERAQLMQTGGDSGDFSQLGMGSSLDSLQGLGGGLGEGVTPDLSRQLQNRQGGGTETGSESSNYGSGVNPFSQSDASSLLLGGGLEAASIRTTSIPMKQIR